MLIRRAPDIRSSEITPRARYLEVMERRSFLRSAALATVGAVAGLAGIPGRRAAAQAPQGQKLTGYQRGGPYDDTTETKTPYEDVVRYNNFYEFGTGKDDPVRYSGAFVPRPWTVRVDGECKKRGDVGLEDLLRSQTLEERVYRMRCVEAWSMVIPWIGIPMKTVLDRFEPTGKAKFVRFETIVRPEQMPAQQGRRSIIDWPYVEGLRMDEAMHPLSIFAVGLYGEVLPNQNGAPLRMVVPWKYGFKSIKSIVRISFVEEEPLNTWQQLQPNEYGFYANVNPEVDHPRWSQASERRIDGGILPRRIDTLMFNGYADQVAGLYAGMDLRAKF